MPLARKVDHKTTPCAVGCVFHMHIGNAKSLLTCLHRQNKCGNRVVQGCGVLCVYRYTTIVCIDDIRVFTKCSITDADNSRILTLVRAGKKTGKDTVKIIGCRHHGSFFGAVKAFTVIGRHQSTKRFSILNGFRGRQDLVFHQKVPPLL